MELVARLIRSACTLVRGERPPIVLRHSATGALFCDGSDEESIVRFESAAEAAAFGDRFLDEAPAWEPVPASQLTRAA
jgi:hypothetical protein